MFYYPEEAATQYTVNKFDDADKGGKGLAEMVRSVADKSIKVGTPQTGPKQELQCYATHDSATLP